MASTSSESAGRVAGVTTGSSRIALTDLPPECLGRVGLLTETVTDMVSLALTCRSLRPLLAGANNQWLWRSRLAIDFGVRVPEGTAASEGRGPRALYLALHSQHSRPVRFQGCYTDGGCDASARRYWVDNLFMENHWDSYCSETGTNVHCAGLLLGTDIDGDELAVHHRQYLIERCRKAAEELFQAQVHLDRWTTFELEHFFLELYNEFRQQTLIGLLILHGVAQQRRQEEAARLRLTMLRVQSHLRTCHDMICPVPSDVELSEKEFPAHLRLFDSSMGDMWARPEHGNWVASVDGCHVSRLGHFSCPVSCGAVFLANHWQCEVGGGTTELRTSIQAAAAETVCEELNDATDREAIDAAVARGGLPPVVSSGCFAGGEWAEFDPDWRPPGDHAHLRPVLWFHFFSASELRERLAEGIPDAPSDGQSSPRVLPGPMETQPAFQIPHGGALAFMMDNHDAEQNGEADAATDPDLPDLADKHKRLMIPLLKRHSGNMAVVKLISHEDLRTEWQDDHENPNVDVSFVSLHGRVADINDVTG